MPAATGLREILEGLVVVIVVELIEIPLIKRLDFDDGNRGLYQNRTSSVSNHVKFCGDEVEHFWSC